MLNKLIALVGAAGLVMTVACAQTDAGITTNVKTKLAADDTVKAYEIDVDTANGVVTLSGTVEDPAAKEQAVLIARQTEGVRDVVDQITVNRTEATTGLQKSEETAGTVGDRTESAARDTADKAGDLGQGTVDRTGELGRQGADSASSAAQKSGAAVSDAALTAAVKAKLLADPMVKGLNIDVDSSNGVVTLSGEVTSKAEMDKAVMIARNTSGVSRVVSNLRVK